MAEEDVIEHIRAREQEAQGQTVIEGKDIDRIPECASCGQDMPPAEYNEHAPDTDYLVHVLPGEDEVTPSGKVYYCGVSCLLQEMGEQFA